MAGGAHLSGCLVNVVDPTNHSSLHLSLLSLSHKVAGHARTQARPPPPAAPPRPSLPCASSPPPHGPAPRELDVPPASAISLHSPPDPGLCPLLLSLTRRPAARAGGAASSSRVRASSSHTGRASGSRGAGRRAHTRAGDAASSRGQAGRRSRAGRRGIDLARGRAARRCGGRGGACDRGLEDASRDALRCGELELSLSRSRSRLRRQPPVAAAAHLHQPATAAASGLQTAAAVGRWRR